MADKLRSLLPYLSQNSLKQLQSLVKNFPNKIYSVEIKIKSRAKTVVSNKNDKVLFGDPTSTTSTTKTTTVTKSQPVTGNHESSSVDMSDTATQSMFDHNIHDPVMIQPNASSVPNAATPTSTPATTATSSDEFVNKRIICDLKKSQQTEIINRTKLLMSLLNRYTENLSTSATLAVTSTQNNRHSQSIQQLMALNANLKDINTHIECYPEANNMFIREKVVSKLLKIREHSLRMENSCDATGPANQNKAYSYLSENSRQALARLGYADPPKGRGIKILSIDGGGTRGLIVLEILRQIEKSTGKKIHEIFDVICGVSTGAILSMLLGALRMPIDECEAYYRQVSSHLFDTDFVRGTSRLLWSHAYYDTPKFEKILKDIYGNSVLIDTRKKGACPHILAISAIVNLPTLQPYIFRNFEHHPSVKPLSHFSGGSHHQIWEAVRASAAAPGYFEEFTIGKHVHQDGGILLNNPTAVAVHEAKLLWPNEQIQCVLSVGSGRYQPAVSIDNIEQETPATLSSLKHKLLRLIDSATDTEMVHRLMMDLLPQNSYFRINPVLRNQSGIDENRPEMLEAMKVDAEMYLRKNDYKFKQVIDQLNVSRSLTQSVLDNLKLKSNLYL